MKNNAQEDKEDRYSVALIGVGIVILLALIEATYRILA
jgi:hypothetical protein|tara:strand:+ start:1984 stop:2097 length:114 start_codon:yes stop_codon:yes gene_type:complete